MTKLKKLKAFFEQTERADVLKAQMAPLQDSPSHDRVMLDHETGAFYLRSDVEKSGMDNAVALGSIDVATESSLFRTTARQVLSEKIEKSVNAPRPH